MIYQQAANITFSLYHSKKQRRKAPVDMGGNAAQDTPGLPLFAQKNIDSHPRI
jgi:hypothetical protein